MQIVISNCYDNYLILLARATKLALSVSLEYESREIFWAEFYVTKG